jgi:hypothetical protein
MLGFEQGHDIVEKVKNFMVCLIVLLELAKVRFLVLDPQDNMCHHVSGME